MEWQEEENRCFWTIVGVGKGPVGYEHMWESTYEELDVGKERYHWHGEETNLLRSPFTSKSDDGNLRSWWRNRNIPQKFKKINIPLWSVFFTLIFI